MIYRTKPQTFVAVAYPGLNLPLCGYARRLGIKVYYYLPPQIWAWGRFRKYFIKKWVDATISVFPFEAEFYRSLKIETIQTPNPLIARLSRYKRTDHRKRIGFMPGSRSNQIKQNMPVIVELVNVLASELKGTELCVIVRDPKEHVIEEVLKARAAIVSENRYQVMKNCDLLVTSSGTATLEAALLGVPQLFFHRPSFVDFYILRRFLRVGEYNLANIFFNQQIVPSLIGRKTSELVQSVYSGTLKHMRSVKTKP
jgi:lipid-A-disaccharide synthase